MKKLTIIGFLFLNIYGCKQCVECRYATFKGTEVQKYCSSTKQDRIDFQNSFELEAQQNGSKAVCTKETY